MGFLLFSSTLSTHDEGREIEQTHQVLELPLPALWSEEKLTPPHTSQVLETLGQFPLLT